MKFETVIGLEIHVQLKTDSKMFCSCKLDESSAPNTNVCPVCMGHPGTLPVTNDQAIIYGLKSGMALGCKIPEYSKFDRKSYFYPDLPKGYQISQYDKPLCKGGIVEVILDGKAKNIKLNRIHLEEDAAKNTHPEKASYSLIDYNRAGTPLMEIVTEPDISSPEEAKIFLQELRTIMRYIDVSDADMEKGQMRVDANISVKETTSNVATKPSEVKNLNSFKAVERAMAYEEQRQQELIEDGKVAESKKETRGWNDQKGETYSQRSKEEAFDYRYFPDPDLPPLNVTDETKEKAKTGMPELPAQKRARFSKQYGLKLDDVNVLAQDHALAGFYEKVVSELESWYEADGIVEKDKNKTYQLAANYMLSELLKHLRANQEEVSDLKVSPENYAEFIKMVQKGEISSSAAQVVLKEMYEAGSDPSDVVRDKDLGQISDTADLEKSVDGVISANQGPVEEFKAGKEQAMQFLIGKVMQETKGKANHQIVGEILKKKLT